MLVVIRTFKGPAQSIMRVADVQLLLSYALLSSLRLEPAVRLTPLEYIAPFFFHVPSRC